VMKKEKLFIIKIGGKVIDDTDQLQKTLENFASLQGYKILVHGGGKLADSYMQKLGIIPKMEKGRRITNTETLEVVQMVYAGLTNKNIVAILQGFGCHAIGLSGADADTIKAEIRRVAEIDYGFAGDVTKVNTQVINQFLHIGLSPVFCALTHNGKGQILNTNADTIAAEIAAAFSNEYETSLLYCFEKKGLLLDQSDGKTVLDSLTLTEYADLKNQGVFVNGIIPKIDNAFDALKNGVDKVYISSINSIKEITSGADLPTRIVLK